MQVWLSPFNVWTLTFIMSHVTTSVTTCRQMFLCHVVFLTQWQHCKYARAIKVCKNMFQRFSSCTDCQVNSIMCCILYNVIKCAVMWCWHLCHDVTYFYVLSSVALIPTNRMLGVVLPCISPDSRLREVYQWTSRYVFSHSPPTLDWLAMPSHHVTRRWFVVVGPAYYNWQIGNRANSVGS